MNRKKESQNINSMETKTKKKAAEENKSG